MRRRLPVLLLAVAVLLGIAGLGALLLRRSGNVPAYSTHNTEPVGARLLFETLERSGMPAERWYDDLDLLGPGTNRLVFALGMDGWRLDGDTRRELSRLARNGATVVIAYEPVDRGAHYYDLAYDDEDREERPAKKARTNRTRRAVGFPGVGYTVSIRPHLSGQTVAQRGVHTPATFPATLPSRTRLYFGSTNEAWRVLYKQDGHAVAIARRHGQGRLVILADVFALSNEGLALNGTAPFVAALAAGSREAVFLEVLHGLRRERSVGDLLEAYGLRAGLTALIVWFALYLWSSAVSLAPRRSVEAASGRRAGRASAEGLSVLLQRAVKPADLLRECWRMWMRNRPRESSGARALQARQKLDGADGAGPLETYREIATILKGRK